MKKEVSLFFYIITQINLSFGNTNLIFHDLKDNFKFKVGISNTSNTKSFNDFQGTEKGARITSLYLGLESGNELSKKTQLNYGLQILNKGVKSGYKYPSSNQPIILLDYRYTLTYIELPINIKFITRLASYKIGLNGSFLIKANFLSYYVNSTSKVNYYYANEITEKFNRFDWGLRIGIEKEIVNHLGIELILQKNLINPYKPNTNELSMQQTVFVGIHYKIF